MFVPKSAVTDPEVIAERQAILCGPPAVAALHAERLRHSRLAAAARERDRRLARAIRRTCL